MGRQAEAALAVGLAVVVAVAAQGLFPPPINVALRAPLNVSSTCGDPESEFCFIPGGVGNKTEFEDVECTVCNLTCPFPDATGPTSPYVLPECHCPDDATLVDVDERKCNLSDGEIVFRINPNAHPPAFANDLPPRSVDDDSIIRTWWQAETYVQDVVFEVDLGRVWQVVDIVVTFFSPRPRAMKLERSLDDDGDTFTAYQFYAADCDGAFNVTAYEPVDEPDDVNCRTDQSFLAPLTKGKVTFNPLTYRANSTAIANRPGFEDRFDPASALKAFASARRLRMEFFELNTLGDVLDPPEENVTNKYFYAIENIVVSARCECNGHAEVCDSSTSFACDCEHNTEGDGCTACLPLYNNKPWAFGTDEDANECVACECNGHASSCHYDAAVDPFPESRTLGGGGVCDNCTDNTCGDQCEVCCPFFYPDVGEPLSSPDRCIPCDCLPAGTADSGECNRDTNSTEPVGQCNCKEHVVGLQCDQCEPGFWNLTESNEDGCQTCTCETSGTVNGTNVCDPVTGQCPCLPNVVGLHCDACAAETYGLPSVAPTPCLDCDCDVGGATTNNCNLTTGQCACVTNTVDGRQCSECSSLHYFPLVTGISLVEAENSVLPGRVGYVTSGNKWYSGPGYVIVKNAEVNAFPNLVIPRDDNYFLSIRYLLPAGANFPLVLSAFDENDDFVLFPKSVALPPAPDAADLPPLGTLLIGGLFEGERIRVQIDANSNNASRVLWIDTVSLVPQRIVDADALASTWYGDLRPDYFGACDDLGQPLTVNDTLACEDFVFSLTAEFLPGCSACSCNANGSLSDACTEYGGQCACRPNVSQRACDRCSASFWNLGQAPSNNGCVPCNCTGAGSVADVCEDATGQCPCLPNVVGRTCDQCAANHFGYGQPSGCSPCNCNTFGSASPQCDSAGVCTCKAGVGGTKCDQCLSGFYAFPTTLASTGCTPCGCDPAGAVNNTCSAATGQCTCKSSVQPSAKCTNCRPTTFNLQTSNPSGCSPCFCYGLTGQCTSDPDGRAENVSSIFLMSADGWTAIGDVSGPVTLNAFLGGTQGGFVRVTTAGNPGLVQYWVAPSKFRGNQLGAYAKFLSIAIRQSKNDTLFSTPLGDVILSGNGVTVVFMLPSAPVAGLTWSQYQILLHPSAGWRLTSLNGPAASANDIQTALANLQDLLIRGEYNAAVTNNDLAEVKLETARLGISGPNSTAVEKCACTGNTRGSSCELCQHGYKRATVNGGPFTPCVPCQCNGHADTCDPETGVCFNCRNNTAGDNCELCAVGYFGDATQGTEDDCQACFCPYQFTSNTSIPAPPPGNGSVHKIIRVTDECSLTPGQGFENATCECPAGYAGFNCETCASNYFGNPMLGIPCHNCTCSGNFNTSLPNQCSTETGCCGSDSDLADPGHCLFNSCGCECDVCCDAFYGEAVFAKNCTACGCDGFGSESPTCNKTTGQCSCRENVVGRTCNACALDTWGLASGDGCEPCGCSVIGSTNSSCDVVTGQCNCIPTVGDRQCDVCQDGYYNFTGAGCQPCDCGIATVDNVCDKTSGQCVCQPGATGRACDQCLPNFVNITSSGCADCGSCYAEVEAAFDTLNNASIALTAQTNMLLAALGGKSGTLQERADGLDAAYLAFGLTTIGLEIQGQAIEDALQELGERVHNQSAILADLAVFEGEIAAFIHGPLQQAVQDVAGDAQDALAAAVQADIVAAEAAIVLSAAQADLAALLAIVADAQAYAASAWAQAVALNGTSAAILQQAEEALAVASDALAAAENATATLAAVLADLAVLDARISAANTEAQATHTLLVETQAEAARQVDEADGAQTETADNVRDPTLTAMGELSAQEAALEAETTRTAILAQEAVELESWAALYTEYLDSVANSSAIGEVEAVLLRVAELAAAADDAEATTTAAQDLAAAVLANATLLAEQVESVNATITAQQQLNAANEARLDAAAATIAAANATVDDAVAAATEAAASASQAADAAAETADFAAVAGHTADLYEASANNASAAAAATLAETAATVADAESLLMTALGMEAVTEYAQANLATDAESTRAQAASLLANVTTSGVANRTIAASAIAQTQSAQIEALKTTSVPSLSDDSFEARLLRARLNRDIELLTTRAALQATQINATRAAIEQAQVRLEQLQVAKDEINPLCFAFE